MSSQNLVLGLAFAALVVAALYAAGPDNVMTGLVTATEFSFADPTFDSVIAYYPQSSGSLFQSNSDSTLKACPKAKSFGNNHFCLKTDILASLSSQELLYSEFSGFLYYSNPSFSESGCPCFTQVQKGVEWFLVGVKERVPNSDQAKFDEWVASRSSSTAPPAPAEPQPPAVAPPGVGGSAPQAAAPPTGAFAVPAKPGVACADGDPKFYHDCGPGKYTGQACNKADGITGKPGICAASAVRYQQSISVQDSDKMFCICAPLGSATANAYSSALSGQAQVGGPVSSPATVSIAGMTLYNLNKWPVGFAGPDTSDKAVKDFVLSKSQGKFIMTENGKPPAVGQGVTVTSQDDSSGTAYSLIQLDGSTLKAISGCSAPSIPTGPDAAAASGSSPSAAADACESQRVLTRSLVNYVLDEGASEDFTKDKCLVEQVEPNSLCLVCGGSAETKCPKAVGSDGKPAAPGPASAAVVPLTSDQKQKLQKDGWAGDGVCSDFKVTMASGAFTGKAEDKIDFTVNLHQVAQQTSTQTDGLSELSLADPAPPAAAPSVSNLPALRFTIALSALRPNILETSFTGKPQVLKSSDCSTHSPSTQCNRLVAAGVCAIKGNACVPGTKSELKVCVGANGKFAYDSMQSKTFIYKCSFKTSECDCQLDLKPEYKDQFKSPSDVFYASSQATIYRPICFNPSFYKTKDDQKDYSGWDNGRCDDLSQDLIEWPDRKPENKASLDSGILPVSFTLKKLSIDLDTGSGKTSTPSKAKAARPDEVSLQGGSSLSLGSIVSSVDFDVIESQDGSLEFAPAAAAPAAKPAAPAAKPEWIKFSASKGAINGNDAAFYVHAGDKVRVIVFARQWFDTTDTISGTQKVYRRYCSTPIQPVQPGNIASALRNVGVFTDYAIPEGTLKPVEAAAPSKPAVVPQKRPPSGGGAPTGGGANPQGGGGGGQGSSGGNLASGSPGQPRGKDAGNSCAAGGVCLSTGACNGKNLGQSDCKPGLICCKIPAPAPKKPPTPAPPTASYCSSKDTQLGCQTCSQDSVAKSGPRFTYQFTGYCGCSDGSTKNGVQNWYDCEKYCKGWGFKPAQVSVYTRGWCVPG